MQKSVVMSAFCETETAGRRIQATVLRHLSLHLMSIPDTHVPRRPHSAHPAIGLQITSTQTDVKDYTEDYLNCSARS